MSRSQRFVDRLVAWSPALLLGSLAALTYWLDAQVQPPVPRIDASRRHAADIFIDNFRGDSFDAEGHLRQSLGAKRARHFADDDTVDFTEPTMSLTDPGQPRIDVSADSGSLSGDRETVMLKGNVRTAREAGAAPTRSDGESTGPVTVLSDTLRVVPKRGLASTDGPVTIEEPRGIIRSVGMELDNDAHTLKLKSNVRGTLQPHTVDDPLKR